MNFQNLSNPSLSSKDSPSAPASVESSTEASEPPDPLPSGATPLTGPSDSGLHPGHPDHPDNVIPFMGKPKTSAAFVVGERTRLFKEKHYPSIPLTQWNDWRWQISHRIKKPEEIQQFLVLSEAERKALYSKTKPFPVAVTPYYMSLIDPLNAEDPLRRSVIPVEDEHHHSEGEEGDPLGEDRDSPVKGLVHRYPDRVLFLLTGFCSTCCRYCTRSRFVKGVQNDSQIKQNWQAAIDYIARTPTIRDVILSGGDPLTMPTEVLESLLSRIRAIPHVEIIRLGTKAPAVLPQRVTFKLAQMIARYHPVFMSIHFTHPDELTPETALACKRLADAGIPLGSQTVLLKGINDSVPVLRDLFCGLLKNRVKPYYLYQCDPISGSKHFRTPVETGLDMIKGLRGHISGYAIPHYVIDAPGGGGKIPLLPEYVKGRDEKGNLLLSNYQDRSFQYPDF